MAGKPVIRGTRIPVERLVAYMAQNLDLDDLFAAYPELSREDVQAALSYAHAKLIGRRPEGQLTASASALGTYDSCWTKSRGASNCQTPTTN